MTEKRTLPLATNNEGHLAYPTDLSRELFTELARLLRREIIKTTADLREWMAQTFENAGEITVVHGLIDRVRNVVFGIGARTPNEQDTLEIIDRVKRIAVVQEERRQRRTQECAGLATLLGTDIAEKFPKLHDFLAHGEWVANDDGQFAHTLAAQFAELHDQHPEGFAKIGDILAERTQWILEVYRQRRARLDSVFKILNCIFQSGAIDGDVAQQRGDLLRQLADQRNDIGSLHALNLIAVSTSQHVPAWKHNARKAATA